MQLYSDQSTAQGVTPYARDLTWKFSFLLSSLGAAKGVCSA
jgi:hypothetical protein